MSFRIILKTHYDILESIIEMHQNEVLMDF